MRDNVAHILIFHLAPAIWVRRAGKGHKDGEDWGRSFSVGEAEEREPIRSGK
jgi:hypothetical protein